jgi:multidrug efflux pump subunit AcrA (membrane-fusion protein)
MRNKIKTVSVIFFFLFLFIFILQYIEFPFTIKGEGILLPEKEWRLTKSQDGTILNVLKDNRINNIPLYTSTEFERGDLIRFSIDCNLRKGDSVSKGDTIGQITSHQEQLKLMELQKELKEQERLLSVNLTGEKPQKIKGALEELRTAEKDFENEKRCFERIKQLHEKDIIADQEFEQAQNTYNLKKQKVLVACANYEDLVAGSKEEQIELIEARIESIKKQINITRERLEALTIISPVSGTFTTEIKTVANGEEILAKVVSNKKMVLIIPVQIDRLRYLEKGLPVKIKCANMKKESNGEVFQIENNVNSLNGRQTIFTTCLIDNDEKMLLPNLKAEGTIICDTISALTYFARWLEKIY